MNMTKAMAVTALAAGMVVAAQAGRFEIYTQQYKTPPFPTKGVVTAGYLGGEGTEWLSGAAFLADGTLVVAGTSLGPKLEKFGGVDLWAKLPATDPATKSDRQSKVPGGVAVKVLGQETPAPAGVAVKRGPKNELQLADPWKMPDATGFVAAVSPDFKNCLWAVRLPWRSGSITDMVADETGIYVIGVAGPQVAALGKGTDVSAEPATENGTTLVVKLAKDGSKILWTRSFTDYGKGPTIRILKDGRIMAEGGWVYVFKPDGTLSEVAKVNKVKNRCRGVDPTTFGCAMGWDTNTHTGREPWRQPHLIIAGPPDKDGKFDKKEYYAWDPKLVGTDQYRLVSDSSFRLLWYDDDGNLFGEGWSDGGNTVLERDPMDLNKSLETAYGIKGLGFSTWGANAGSFSHLLKWKPGLDQLTPLNKTLWASYLQRKDKPNAAFINQVRVASDGSVLITGGSAHHLIQTGDAIHWNPEQCSGPYVAVLKDDFTSIRFSSIIEATAPFVLRDRQTWGIASRKVNGRNYAAFVTSATPTHGGSDRTAPMRNPIQPAFAGGLTDGYLIVVDLGP